MTLLCLLLLYSTWNFVIGRNTACRWMLFRLHVHELPRNAKEVSKLTSLFGSTAACVCTIFRLRTVFRCVICLKCDQTCTPGHRPAIQALEPRSRAWIAGHAPAYMSDCIHQISNTTHLHSEQVYGPHDTGAYGSTVRMPLWLAVRNKKSHVYWQSTHCVRTMYIYTVSLMYEVNTKWYRLQYINVIFSYRVLESSLDSESARSIAYRVLVWSLVIFPLSFTSCPLLQ